MYCDCHMHMVLDGQYWKSAIERHADGVNRDWIAGILEVYREKGFTYLRDGGDRWGAGAKARELAPEYGITYRTPLAPLCKAGHYGTFIGEKYENFKEYLYDLYASFPEGVTETYLHPSLETDDLKGTTGAWERRVWEYKIMSDPQTKQHIEAHGIKLINYRDLAEMRK